MRAFVEARTRRRTGLQAVRTLPVGLEPQPLTQLGQLRTPRGNERSLVLGGGLGGGVGRLLHEGGGRVHGNPGRERESYILAPR